MPDLLSHALAAYSIGMILSWRIEWLDSSYVTTIMVGALLPDLVKIKLLIPSAEMSALLGVPFSWLPLHTVTGVVLSALLLGSVVGRKTERWRVLSTACIGAVSHLVLDGLLRTPTGRGAPVFWPLSEYQPPTPGLYLSTEPWPTALFVVVALSVLYVDRRASTE